VREEKVGIEVTSADKDVTREIGGVSGGEGLKKKEKNGDAQR